MCVGNTKYNIDRHLGWIKPGSREQRYDMLECMSLQEISHTLWGRTHQGASQGNLPVPYSTRICQDMRNAPLQRANWTVWNGKQISTTGLSTTHKRVMYQCSVTYTCTHTHEQVGQPVVWEIKMIHTSLVVRATGQWKERCAHKELDVSTVYIS